MNKPPERSENEWPKAYPKHSVFKYVMWCGDSEWKSMVQRVKDFYSEMGIEVDIKYEGGEWLLVGKGGYIKLQDRMILTTYRGRFIIIEWEQFELEYEMIHDL